MIHCENHSMLYLKSVYHLNKWSNAQSPNSKHLIGYIWVKWSALVYYIFVLNDNTLILYTANIILLIYTIIAFVHLNFMILSHF